MFYSPQTAEAFALSWGKSNDPSRPPQRGGRSEEHTSELQSLTNIVCRLLLEIKNARLVGATRDSHKLNVREIEKLRPVGGQLLAFSQVFDGDQCDGRSADRLRQRGLELDLCP